MGSWPPSTWSPIGTPGTGAALFAERVLNAWTESRGAIQQRGQHHAACRRPKCRSLPGSGAGNDEECTYIPQQCRSPLLRDHGDSVASWTRFSADRSARQPAGGDRERSLSESLFPGGDAVGQHVGYWRTLLGNRWACQRQCVRIRRRGADAGACTSRLRRCPASPRRCDP